MPQGCRGLRRRGGSFGVPRRSSASPGSLEERERSGLRRGPRRPRSAEDRATASRCRGGGPDPPGPQLDQPARLAERSTAQLIPSAAAARAAGRARGTTSASERCTATVHRASPWARASRRATRSIVSARSTAVPFVALASVLSGSLHRWQVGLRLSSAPFLRTGLEEPRRPGGVRGGSAGRTRRTGRPPAAPPVERRRRGRAWRPGPLGRGADSPAFIRCRIGTESVAAAVKMERAASRRTAPSSSDSARIIALTRTARRKARPQRRPERLRVPWRDRPVPEASTARRWPRRSR